VERKNNIFTLKIHLSLS